MLACHVFTTKAKVLQPKLVTSMGPLLQHTAPKGQILKVGYFEDTDGSHDTGEIRHHGKCEPPY